VEIACSDVVDWNTFYYLFTSLINLYVLYTFESSAVDEQLLSIAINNLELIQTRTDIEEGMKGANMLHIACNFHQFVSAVLSNRFVYAIT
jgi:hypothetical protein